MANSRSSAPIVQCDDLCAGYAVKHPNDSSCSPFFFGLLTLKQVIGPITHTLSPGEFTGVIGYNGAGKSSFLKTLTSLLPVLSGNLSYSEEPSSIIELGAPSSHWMTGRQYVEEYFAIKMLTFPSHTLRQNYLEEAEKFASIGAAYDDPMWTYSSGMRARVLFAAAFSAPTPYILLDEILSVGDAAFTSKCWRLITQKLQAGMSGYLVTHDWSAVLRLCNHCLWLDQGQIKLSGKPQHVVADYLNHDLPDDDISIFSNLTLANYDYNSSNQQLSLTFEFSDILDTQLHVSASVEDVGQGRGWQIIGLTEFHPLSLHRYNQFVLNLSPIPLANGTYEVCLFFKSVNSTTSLSQTYSWFNGHSFPVSISETSDYFLLDITSQPT